ncbi:MAG: ComF family protein, partial [Gammaproteobacteria bacterium]|nr:ComF family protein [Gammaproteobacteria bacterium]
QALELARPLAKHFTIPIDYHSCQRVRATQRQSDMPAKERKSNVKNAFVINDKFAVKHVAVIDDVITTGHTMEECCRMLRKQQVEKIDLWCIARTTYEK